MKTIFKNSVVTIVAFFLFLAIGISTVYGVSKWQKIQPATSFSVEEVNNHNHGAGRYEELFTIDYVDGDIMLNSNNAVANKYDYDVATTAAGSSFKTDKNYLVTTYLKDCNSNCEDVCSVHNYKEVSISSINIKGGTKISINESERAIILNSPKGYADVKIVISSTICNDCYKEGLSCVSHDKKVTTIETYIEEFDRNYSGRVTFDVMMVPVEYKPLKAWYQFGDAQHTSWYSATITDPTLFTEDGNYDIFRDCGSNGPSYNIDTSKHSDSNYVLLGWYLNLGRLEEVGFNSSITELGDAKREQIAIFKSGNKILEFIVDLENTTEIVGTDKETVVVKKILSMKGHPESQWCDELFNDAKLITAKCIPELAFYVRNEGLFHYEYKNEVVNETSGSIFSPNGEINKDNINSVKSFWGNDENGLNAKNNLCGVIGNDINGLQNLTEVKVFVDQKLGSTYLTTYCFDDNDEEAFMNSEDAFEFAEQNIIGKVVGDVPDSVYDNPGFILWNYGFKLVDYLWQIEYPNGEVKYIALYEVWGDNDAIFSHYDYIESDTEKGIREAISEEEYRYQIEPKYVSKFEQLLEKIQLDTPGSKLVLIPYWRPVVISIDEYSEVEVDCGEWEPPENFNFGSPYNISGYGKKGVGKEFYNFEARGDELKDDIEANTLIAEQGVWNYSLISDSAFTYIKEQYYDETLDDNIEKEYYKLKLYSATLDVLKRVSLSGVETHNGHYELKDWAINLIGDSTFELREESSKYNFVEYDAEMPTAITWEKYKEGILDVNKNTITYIPYDAAIYTSMDKYSEMAAKFREAYEYAISFNGTRWLDAMGKVYVHKSIYNSSYITGTANNYNMYIYLPCNQKTLLPTFVTDAKIVVAWTNDDVCTGYCQDETHNHKRYPTPSYNQQLALVNNISSDEVYENYSTLYPIYRNILRMYSETSVNNYEDGNEDKYKETIALYYGALDRDLTDIKLNLDMLTNKNRPLGDDLYLGSDYKYTFGGWMFDTAAAEEKYTYDYSNGVLTVTSKLTGKVTRFDAELIQGTDNYTITSVSGKEFEQDNTKPIIKVKWNRTYSVIFNNSIDATDIYWADMSATQNDDTLFGAVSINGKSNSGEYYETTIMVSAYKTWFAGFKFMSSAEYSFYKRENFDQNNGMSSSFGGPKGKISYSVYNYGHQVTKYLIYFEHDGVRYEIYINNSQQFEARVYGGQSIDLEDLNRQYTTLDYLASFMDDFLTRKDGNNFDDSVVFTIVPIWEAVSIETSADANGGMFKFGDNYSLIEDLNPKETEDGGYQTHFAYTTNNSGEIENAESVVAITAVWNYTKLATQAYSYDFANNLYLIELYPMYLDDFMKVNLSVDDLFKNDNGYYELSTDGEFEFATGKTENRYSFKDVIEVKPFSEGVNDEYLGLVDKYIEILMLKLAEYKGSSLDIFKRVYATETSYSPTLLQTDGEMYVYLVAGGEYDLPTFKDKLGITLAWAYLDEDGDIDYLYNASKYSVEEIENGTYKEFGLKNIKEKFTYVKDLKLVPYYIYSLELFYDSPNNSGGYDSLSVNTSILENDESNKPGYFGKNITLQLENQETTEIKIKPEETNPGEQNIQNGIINSNFGICQVVNGEIRSVFDCWMLDVSKLEANGYTSTTDVAPGCVTIIGQNGASWDFYISDKNEYNENIYYITGVKSTTIAGQRMVNLRFVQNTPIITAKWRNFYDLTIDNSNPGYWNSSLDSSYNLHYARSSEDSNKSSQTTFKIANHSYYNGLGFATSGSINSDNKEVGYAFAECIESNTGKTGVWYQIKHFGHYVIGYEMIVKIKTLGGGGETELTYYFICENGKIKGKTPRDLVSGTYSDITLLKDQSLKGLAEELDELIVAYSSDSRAVTMKPIWQAATISAVNSEDEALFSDIYFGNSYTINEKFERNSGQSIMATYVANDINSYVALSAVWNYQTINSFTYEGDGSLLGKGRYIIQLNPYYVDNIYKVTLADIQKTNKYYVLRSDTYIFNSNNGLSINGSGFEITDSYELKFSDIIHDNSNFVYLYKDFASYGSILVDDYIEELKTMITIYEQGISTGVVVNGENKGLFSLLRKVFYNNGTNCLDATTLNPSNPDNQPEMWIYLANNQTYGNLPVFESMSNTLIYWLNNNPNNNPDNDENTGKNYIYKTDLFDESDEDHKTSIDGKCYHGTQLEDRCCDCESNVNCLNKWLYSDGYDGTCLNVTFKASYFRKYFYISVETLKETAIERRGFVTIELEDYSNDSVNKSGKYVFIYDNDSNEMKIYSYDNFYSIKNYLDGDKIEVGIKLMDEAGKNISAIQVYAGCSISFHVYDQSQDVDSMRTGDFDDMIGYRFSGEISQTYRYKNQNDENANLLFEDFVGYEVKLEPYPAEEDVEITTDYILGKNYAHGSWIRLGVEFEKIKYTMTIDIDLEEIEGKDFYSGYLVLNDNEYLENYTFTNITVEELYNLYYYAYTGFKLQNNAFVLKISDNEEAYVYLQQYSEDIGLLTDIEKEQYLNATGEFDEQLYLTDQQNYIMTHFNPGNLLDGTWLRLNYYNKIEEIIENGVVYIDSLDYDNAYNCQTNITLGTLSVQTSPIEFDFGLKIYDSNRNVNTIIETNTLEGSSYNKIKFDGSKSYTSDQAKMIIYKDSLFLSGMDELDAENYLEFYYYTAQNGSRYAVLSSRLYFPASQYSSKLNNFNADYTFLSTVAQYELSQRDPSHSWLSYMLNNHIPGKIVVTTDRSLFLMFEVRELYKVNIQAERQAGDPNATTRSTTVSNGNGNSKTLTLSAGSLYDEDTNIYNTTETVYTYLGLENNISSVWEESSYSDAEYYLNGSTERLSGLKFTLNSNDVNDAQATLTVKFIPENLKIVHEYYLNGHLMVKDFDSYVAETVNPNTNIKIGDVLTYNLTCLKNDYTVSVRINSSEIKSTTLSNLELEMEYEITEADYQYNQITIRVEINALPKGSIQIKYHLIENNVLTDNYGTFTVYQELKDAAVEPDVVEESIGGSYQILTGRTVYVQPKFEPGFYYTGKIAFNTFSAKDIELDSEGRLDVLKAVDSLTNGFDPDVSTGIFTIYIAKTPITVTLDTTGVVDGSTYTINNQSKVDNMYVNSTIQFAGTQVAGQRFNSYFYVNSEGDQVRFENISTSKVINSDLLKDMLGEDKEYSQSPEELIFYVETVNTYKAEFEIEGTDYLSEFSIQINGKNEICLPRSVDGKQNAVRYVTDYYDQGSVLTFSVSTIKIGKYQIVIDNPQSKYTLETGIDNSGKYDLINFGNMSVELTSNHSETIKIIPYSYHATVTSESVFKTISQINSNRPEPVTSGFVNGLTQENLTYGAIGVIKFARVVEDRELCTVYISGNDMNDKLCIKYNQTEFVVYKVEIDPETGNETVGTQQVDAQDYGLTIRNLTASGYVEISFETQNDINIGLEYVLYKNIRL